MKCIAVLCLGLVAACGGHREADVNNAKQPRQEVTPADESGFVVYRGIQMIEGWPEQIEAAQKVTHYLIGGERLNR